MTNSHSSRSLMALGTACQSPTKERNHNAYFLRWEEHGILFDPGEGTQRQMTLFGVPASSITKILLSHFHGDHCLGLPGLWQRFLVEGVTQEIDFYYPASGEELVDHLIAFSNFKQGIRIRRHPLRQAGVIYEDEKVRIHCAPLDHTVDCYGYRVEEKTRINLLPDRIRELQIPPKQLSMLKKKGFIELHGQTILLEAVATRLPGQSVAYLLDTRPCSNCCLLADNVDLLLTEATYLQSEVAYAQQYGHMTAKQAAEVARQSRVKRLLLTHFSQRYPSSKQHVEEALTVFPTVYALKDGDVVEIPRLSRGF